MSPLRRRRIDECSPPVGAITRQGILLGEHSKFAARKLAVQARREHGLARGIVVDPLTAILAALEVALALAAIAPRMTPLFAGGLLWERRPTEQAIGDWHQRLTAKATNDS